MPIRKPIKTIKKKLGLKKTFEKKRKALGFEGSISGIKGQLTVKTSTNPKIRQIAATSFKKLDKLNNKLIKLGEFKPKNEIESRKKKDAIALVKEKIKEEKNSAELKIRSVNIERNSERQKRQAKIISKKLFNLLDENEKRIIYMKSKLIFNELSLRKKYQELLKTKKKTFADVSSKEAFDLLKSSIKTK